ncbi:hypothetical protein [Cryobacterium sp. PAMC25264]|uniref:hypothetical protein n=1 Tax=Cryobacterium sp. PAMC25264 TaxID=2861288 RepID=UPI001C62B0C0|nr:hypothetical protein [Cryobacterium sp. PAMC25264]QYF74161.1 hypothetical protein KY500_02675 [Cryobacterium sp. PAMC25264]
METFRRLTGDTAYKQNPGVVGVAAPRAHYRGPAGSLLVSAVLVLTGCAGAAPAAEAPSSAAPSPATPAPTAVGACPESDGQGPWGDVIAKEQVEDDAGSYCHTTLDPASARARFDPAVVDLDSLATYGFTIEEAEAAQRAALVYVTEAGLDSALLDDSTTADATWFEAASPWFTPAAHAALAPHVASYGLRDAGVIVSQSLPSPLTRDGGPRATTTAVGVDKIFATLSVDQQTPLLLVRTTVTVDFAATDAAIVAAAIRDERGTTTLSEDSLRASTPTLFDGADDEGLVLAGGFNVGFASGDLTAIEYIGAAWTLSTGDGALQIDAVEPELDPSLR